MDDRTAKTLDFVSIAVRQVLTLSTLLAGGVILLSQASLDADESLPDAVCWLRWGLMAYVVSICFGAWTLYKLADAVSRKGKKYRDPGVIDRPFVFIPAAVQFLSFGTATVFIAIYGWNLLT